MIKQLKRAICNMCLIYIKDMQSLLIYKIRVPFKSIVASKVFVLKEFETN